MQSLLFGDIFANIGAAWATMNLSTS